MGIGGGTFLTGWKAAVLKEWTFLIPITWGTGLPENPNYTTGLLGGTAFSGPLRPSFTGASLTDAPAGRFLNPDAFVAPAPGTFGDAGRDSITGPYRFSLGASMQRTFRVSDRITLNLRVDSTNTLNHVTVSSYIVNFPSTQLGAASGVNQMRQMTTTAQFRF
jgi:trimeric autotransporter adhesin